MATPKYTNKLQGKRVQIFGGTSGIGHAVAEAVLEFGGDVVISGSKPDKLNKAVDRLKESSASKAEVASVTCDLSRSQGLEENLREAFKLASADGAKKIDHIVYTAGDPLNVNGGITGTDIELINSVMCVRVFAPTLIAKIIATTEYVKKSHTSSLTMTAGTAHLRSRETWSVVAMVAGAIHGLVTGLAVDLAPVRVNAVDPGLTETELAANMPAQMLEGAKQGTLTKRNGQPEDIAEAYLYFMKDHSADGVAIVSDNGKLVKV